MILHRLKTEYLFLAILCARNFAAFAYHPLDLMDGFHLDEDATQMHHTHRFVHDDAQSGTATFFEYNVTKCAKHRYKQIPSASTLKCLSENEISLKFPDRKSADVFCSEIRQGTILMSHHTMRCKKNGKGVLMEIETFERLGELRCSVRGKPRQPVEFFQHAKIEFRTNIVPETDMTCANTLLSQASTEKMKHKTQQSFRPLEIAPFTKRTASRGAVDRLLKNSTSIEIFENLTKNAYDYYTSLENARSASPSLSRSPKDGVHIDSVKTTGSWRVPFPSEIFWEEPLYPRMLCANCYLRVQPIIRFSLHIENYQLKAFHLSMEGNTHLAIFPHVDINDSGLFQRFKLLERSFRPVYLSIGGVPYYITPHLKVTLKFAHRLNAKAEIGFQTGFIGAMHVGIDIRNSRPEFIGKLSFQQVPVDFLYSMGKSCKAFDGKTLFGSLKECARRCADDPSCSAYQYIKSLGKCRLTKKCDEIDNPTADELLFKHESWVVPEPNPNVTGTVRILVASHLAMIINAIGGPMVSLNQSLNWNFIHTDMQTYSRTNIDYKVNAAIGGRIQLRTGNHIVYEDELKFRPVLTHTETLWTHDYRVE